MCNSYIKNQTLDNHWWRENSYLIFFSQLGIDCNSNMSDQKITQYASVKIWGTYMGIVSKGIGPETLNANTSMTIYISAVLPQTIYGCKLWWNVLAKDLLKLHKAHIFCIKHGQELHVSTSTDFRSQLLSVYRYRQLLTIINRNSLDSCTDLIPCLWWNTYFTKGW